MDNNSSPLDNQSDQWNGHHFNLVHYHQKDQGVTIGLRTGASLGARKK
jgi:hypothetical protein